MKPMTEVMVLRTVPVSENGITLRVIVKGTVDQVPNELFEGLKAEGYVVEAGDTGPEAILGLPEDWRDLHHMKLITLAKAFDPSVSNKAEAVAALEAAEKAAAGTAQG